MARGFDVDALRALALSLPGATEELTWETHPTFRVRGKIFVIVGADGLEASVKASKEDQQALLREAPDAYAPAPYLGRHGWVRVTLAAADSDELAEVIIDAWRLTAAKRVVAAFDAEIERAGE